MSAVAPILRTRRCMACSREMSIEEFAPLEQKPGSTIDRRRVCKRCIGAVDEKLRAADGPANVSAIARAASVSPTLVRERREALGLPAKGYKRLDDIDALVEMTLAQKPITEISRALGVSTTTVARHQAPLGIREPRGRRRKPLLDSELERMRQMLDDEEVSYPEVARTFGVDVSTVRRHFPGRRWSSESRGAFAAITLAMSLDNRMRALHEEIFHGKA